MLISVILMHFIILDNRRRINASRQNSKEQQKFKGCLQNQEPNGMEWNGMKFTFQENKKPGMERNGMEWKGMETNGKEWNEIENYKFLK